MQGRSDIGQMPIDESIKTNFRNFMTQMQRYNGTPIEQVRGAMLPAYGDTYFYEYFFLKDITYY